jgi:beta-glucanase (GH16 family)
MSSLTFVHFFPLLTAFCFNIPVASAASPWIDPDTPRYAQLISPLSPGDERSYQLVFSDEFNVNGRVFHDGYDPRWTALSKNDVTNNPLHYYSSDTITTSGGVLNLTIDYDPKTFLNKNNVTETKNYRSGMLQSWNKFCFMGGIVEFSVKLPGNPRVGGLWPASK